MPTKVFFELDYNKMKKITEESMIEFATYGYYNSSTNRIVRNAGISKGSLFQYFTNKEDLFFYILDHVTEEMIRDLERESSNLSRDLFQRIIEYSTLEFAWYTRHPVKSKLIIKSFTKNDTELYQKIIERYDRTGQNLFDKLLSDIDSGQLQWGKEKTIHVLKWFLTGFNNDFRESQQLEQEPDYESIRMEYLTKLTEYMELLKSGLMRSL